MDTITAPTAHFIAFAAMSPRQQAEHLVYAHGLDRGYFAEPDVEALADLADAQIVQYFIDGDLTDDATGGFSYPHPDSRTSWHEGDHEDGVGAWHTHSKVA